MNESSHSSIWLKLQLQLHRYRDWRVVEAEDASGTRCRCLLLPMEKNAIREKRDGPSQTIMVMRRRSGEGLNDMTLGFMLPWMSEAECDALIEKGWLDPASKTNGRRIPPCGFVLRPFWDK